MGNEYEHWETFLVDSTPPETEKWYGEPFVYDYFPKGCYEFCELECEDDIECMYSCLYGSCGWAEWITTQTPVYMEAIDNKVGVENIYWRNMVITDPEAAWEICGHIPTDGDYCDPRYYMQWVDNPEAWR